MYGGIKKQRKPKMKKKKTMKDNIMKGVRNLFRIKRENEATKTEILKTFLN